TKARIEFAGDSFGPHCRTVGRGGGTKTTVSQEFRGLLASPYDAAGFVVVRPRSCGAGHFPDRLYALFSLCRQFAGYHFFKYRRVSGGFRLGGIEGRRREEPD